MIGIVVPVLLRAGETLAFGSGNGNVCLIQGTDGTWYGAELATAPNTWSFGGPITPPDAVSGQLSFALKWSPDGRFVVRLGDLGDEPLPDVNLAVVRYSGHAVSLIWDSTDLHYLGTDTALTDTLMDHYILGEQNCGISISAVPNKFISINLDLQRGASL